MENNNLFKPGRIQPANLDYHQLTLSLLQEAMRTGLLPENEVEKLQTQLMLLLSEVILQYTHHESTSVRTEKAESILQSILYNIDMYLKKLSSPDQAIEALQSMKMPELYDQGLKLVDEEVEQAQQLLQEVEHTRLSLSHISYNDTIDNSFSEFFESYDTRFDAHDTVASIDYPLLSDDMSWTGIIYIRRYLEHLKLENEICAHFPISNIKQLIKGWGQKNGIASDVLLFNIPELILKNSLCSVLMGKRADNLPIEQEDCDLLEGKLQSLTEQQFPQLLGSAMAEIFKQLELTKPVLQDYLQSFIKDFCPLLINAVRENTVTSLIVLAKDVSPSNTIHYEPGQKLSDEDLRTLISELEECDDGKAKADLIKSAIHNIEDLLDIFSAFCIFDEEYLTIFNQMDDYELAILASNIVDNSPLSDDMALTLEPWYKPEYELYWQGKLKDYFEAGDSKRYKNIMQLAGELRKQK